MGLGGRREFRDYSFYDALLDEKKTRQHESVDLGEQKTDADGHAELDLQLDRFADATYSMQFFAEAFEGEGGRSITGQASTLVSALPYVVGYKADGDLNYINANTPARGRSCSPSIRSSIRIAIAERDAGCRSRRNTSLSSRKRKMAVTDMNQF